MWRTSIGHETFEKKWKMENSKRRVLFLNILSLFAVQNKRFLYLFWPFRGRLAARRVLFSNIFSILRNSDCCRVSLLGAAHRPNHRKPPDARDVVQLSRGKRANDSTHPIDAFTSSFCFIGVTIQLPERQTPPILTCDDDDDSENILWIPLFARAVSFPCAHTYVKSRKRWQRRRPLYSFLSRRTEKYRFVKVEQTYELFCFV